MFRFTTATPCMDSFLCNLTIRKVRQATAYFLHRALVIENDYHSIKVLKHPRTIELKRDNDHYSHLVNSLVKICVACQSDLWQSATRLHSEVRQLDMRLQVWIDNAARKLVQ